MESMKNMVPFGRLHIPPPDEDLTATYTATSFAELTKAWRIKAYMTYPGTDEPMDLPSVTFTVSSRRPLEGPGPSSRRPEVAESLERSLREHGDVWAELAKR